MAFRFLTAGESHGEALTAVIDGVPAGLGLTEEHLNEDLARRQRGYGRGGRMKIERDQAHISSGVRWGVTLGSPITLTVQNRDWENWKQTMAVGEPPAGAPPKTITRPRPGHADLAGAMKYGHRDIRNVLERSSARETTARVAVAGVAKRLLREFGITILSHVTEIGGVHIGPLEMAWDEVRSRAEVSEVRCADPAAELAIIEAIDRAKEAGDTLGGVFDGMGFEAARRPGSQVHDEILFDSDSGFHRRSNSAGGLEGGVTNGQPVVVRAAMKPISTLRKPLQSVDMATKETVEAVVERSDVCAVPAAGVVGEAMMALVLAEAFLEKFAGDSIDEIRRNYQGYLDYLKSW